MSWELELRPSVASITIRESAFSSAPEHVTQHKSRVDSQNRNQERSSKSNKGEGIPESQEGGPETQIQFPSVKDRMKSFESPASTNESDKPPQKESRVNSPKRVPERFSKWSKGNADSEIEERASPHMPQKPLLMENGVDSHKSMQESFSNRNVDVENLGKGPETQIQSPSVKDRMKNFESPALSNESDKPPQKESRVNSPKRVPERFPKQSKGNGDPEIEERGRTVDMNTSGVLASMREEMKKILSEKLDVLQSKLETTQHAVPPMEELTKTQTSLQKISESVQALQTSMENMQVPTKKDLEVLRAVLEGKETKALTNESDKPPQKESRVDSHKSVQEKFSDQSKGNADALTLERDFLKAQRYKVDVTLNPDTAHPRLELSEDGKSVKDTGEIRQVPNKEERFDSHIFVLAKEGYTSGKHYWEVTVGKRRNWILGVASESVARKGTLILSPKNGFWVIGLADGQEYWAYTDPWTRLTVGGRPQKIGIFLDISANKLSFYNANKKKDLHTFTMIGDSRQGTKFVPFFSTASGGASVLDTEPLKIVQGFDDDD